jgi:glutathione S-transferase
MTTPVLCYWDIRGLAQPIRLLLNYTGTEFEDRMLSCGPAPGFDKSCWFDNKFSFGLDFPNLPYYIDGEVKITQSNAILRHIARKNDLVGKSEKEKAMVDMMADQSMDFRNGWVRLCYNPDFANLKDDYLKALPKTLQQFSDFLGGKAWFAGESLSFVDFVMYELVDQHKLLEPSCLDKLGNMQKFMERFEALPKISEYMKGEKFMKAPINNKMAKFGF